MIQVLAPAKVNLGLEILGKRADGYHEIRTILCAVSILDTLDFAKESPGGLIVEDSELTGDNLVEQALHLLERTYPPFRKPAVFLRKRIPVAAGLGGASSDAAATLLAVRNLIPDALDDCKLDALASRLGSDVPFFLQAGLAKASGRGEQLRYLPFQRVDVVIVQPPLSIPAKTATMYESLESRDWTDGSAVENLASSIGNGVAVEPGLPLPNAFSRPLCEMHPQLIELAARIGQIAESPAQLSGAGPAHFVLCRDGEHRQWVRNRLRTNLPLDRLRVIAARSVKSPLLRAI